MELVESIGKLRNNFIFIVLLSFSGVVMAKEEIEINFTSAPTFNSGGDVQKILIKDNNQYYYKKTNVYNSMVDTIQGIGIVSGNASSNDWYDYKKFKNDMFIVARDHNNVNARAKRISVKYKTDKDVYNSEISLNNTSESKRYESWFRSKKVNFSDPTNYRLVGGFTIDHSIKKIDNFYEVDLIIQNNSEKLLKLSGVKKWESAELSRSLTKAVLVLSNDDESHQFFLNNTNIDGKFNLDEIVVNPKKNTVLKFNIHEDDIDKILKKGKNFVSYINLNLYVENDFEVSGKISYSTIFKKII